MAKYSTGVLSATTAVTALMAVHVPQTRNSWIGTAVVSGSFGNNASATLAVYLSGDGGTTTTVLRTPAGVLVSTNAPIVFSPIELGNQIGSKTPLSIYYSLTPMGAAGSVSLDIYDNN